jgi:hypothetical protein
MDRNVPRTRIVSCALIALLLAAAPLVAAPADAQALTRVRVTRATVVMEGPRGDSVVLGRVAAGTVLEALQQIGRWIEVTTPPGTPGIAWARGWVAETAVEYLDARPQARAEQGGEFMIRAFGQFGGSLFTSQDSFEAILESPFGTVIGGGAQVVFRQGLFVQAGVEQFSETGRRVIASSDQLFSTTIPVTVTITPVVVTVGYRQPTSNRLAGYVGAGVGWHVLEEETPTLANGSSREGHVGYHVSGGVEFGLAPFLWLAGEVQWAGVPDGLSETGIGAVFGETDLGGTTFRFKVIVGR